tara:strand:+ start:354 stop:713 length:360 start_codon:yes stop_codon:yes gene_type:complete
MTILTRDQILSANDQTTETVEVPEWGGSVIVSTMSGRERDAFESSLMADKGSSKSANMANLRARLASLCCVAEDGTRMFTQADIEALGNKSAAALNRIFLAAQRLNGIGEDAVEELAGN